MENIDASETALVVVHLQNDIVAPGTAFGSLFRSEVERVGTIEQVNRLAAALRAAGGRVVWVRMALEPDYSDSNPGIPLLAMAQEAGALVEGTPGAELTEEADARPEDHVVRHSRPNPFVDTNLAREFGGLDNVIVAGVATNASVESTFRYLADYDFRTILATDACSAATPEAHAATVSSLALFGEMATVEEIVGALTEHPRPARARA